MVQPPVEFNPAQWGATGAILLLLWKLLEVAKVMFLNKQQPAAHQHRRSGDSDPLHDLQMEEVHDKIMDGKLGCHWKDREEVRDFIEAMRAQTSASKAQTTAINNLVNEMRQTRNGGATR